MPPSEKRRTEASSGTKSSSEDALEATLPSGEFPAHVSAPARADLSKTVPDHRADAAPAPGQAVGRFLVVRQLGSGAMGLVLSAYDPVLDRKVALKLLHKGATGDSAGRQRLLREAQAMARLAHPNVVTVFEVGTVGDTVFLAMEHIEGTTLGDWVGQRRSWRAVLATFLAAGRGLAAAHAAGIVHRDFKPENVLVAGDGRVRVSDFGLASAPPGNRFSATTAAVAPPAQGASPSLTHDGSLIGTPLYMSPEQHQGAAADARSDQFSFCVALYEGLYRETPFVGDSYAAYADEVLAGRVRPPPRGADVPAWVRAVLLRGMATDPAARYPSMDSLLDALARDPAQRRRRLAAALGVAVLAGVAVYGMVGWRRAAAASPCAASQEASAKSLAGAWDAAVRGQVSAAFEASPRPRARDNLTRVEHALDRRAGAIAAMRRDACEATHVRGEQSAELLDRRIHCLDQRVAELRAVTGLLARPDDEMVDRSVEAVLGMKPVEACADSAALLAAVPPPSDPALRERVAAARRSLAELDALVVAGKYKPALIAARAATAEAAALGYAPVHAEAAHRQAEIEVRMADVDAARASLEAAVASAAAARDDAAFARAVSQLYHVIGYGQQKPAEAQVLLPVARAAVARAGSGAELRAMLDGATGAVAQASGRYQDAADAFTRALEATEAARGPDDLRVAMALNNLGHARSSLGLYPEALAAHRRALAIREKSLGPDHPLAAASLGSVAGVLNHMAEHEESLAAFQRVLAVREAVLGADHPLVADTLDSVGLVLSDLDRNQEALVHHRRALAMREKRQGPDHLDVAGTAAKLGSLLHGIGRDREAIAYHQRALAVREKQLGRDHPEVASTLNNMALAVRGSDHARARALLRRALAIREKTLGPDHPELGSTVNNLALEEFEAGRHAEAAGLYRRVVPIWEKSLGPQHPRTLVAVYYLGRSELAAGRAAPAVELFERALAGYLAEGARAPRDQIPAVRVALANALWRANRRGQRARARAEVKAARRQLVADGRAAEADQMKRWLATHRR
ncbi:MAG TPA: serine/threonine-protein kinase [Kofleriaceae bacterium]|nr:serine/threonine-protein kinase [Kofleriaceae bacterium]